MKHSWVRLLQKNAIGQGNKTTVKVLGSVLYKITSMYNIMYSKLCREQELNDGRLITTLLLFLANNNIELNPAVKASLDVFICLWHKLGKHISRKKTAQNKVYALGGIEFVITLSLQAIGCETSKKSSRFLTSVIPNLEQLSASLTYVQGLIID